MCLSFPEYFVGGCTRARFLHIQLQMCSASRQRFAYGLLKRSFPCIRDAPEFQTAKNGCADLWPRLEPPNDAFLMDAHEPHFCDQVHDEVPAVRCTDATTQFLAGALLSMLLYEPRVMLARKWHMLLASPPLSID